MNYLKKWELWKNDDFFDEETRMELSSLSDEREIEDRFYKELSFGTGGLRGIMGAGTNRMNRYTIGKATAGLGRYLLESFGEERCKTQGVVAGYDTRNNSRYFAETVSQVLSGMGIKVLLHSICIPTPQLSFAVNKLNALAGVVITASHNPKEYNGYKIYDENGCQLIPEKARKIAGYIDKIDDCRLVDFGGNDKLIEYIDTTDEYVRAVLKQSCLDNLSVKNNLNIVYTPIHGTGYIPITKVLASDGFTKLHVVEEQKYPDGNFPSVASPNPEEKSALTLGIQYAEAMDADIVLGTDPDADRVGIAVKMTDGYKLLSGNQIGALLTDFVMSGCSAEKPAVINTIVTSQLGTEIAQSKGAEVFSTLTGFKFIGEKIIQFENAKRNGDLTHSFDFVLGYEESYGYLAGTHAKDKDAAVACLLICEMAAKCKADGLTLCDKLDLIYKTHGYYYDALDSYTLSGKKGLEKIEKIMSLFRGGMKPFDDICEILDYNSDGIISDIFGKLPKADVLKFVMMDGSWVAVRPSGTEPKIKIYYSIKDTCEEKAKKRFEAMHVKIKELIDSI